MHRSTLALLYSPLVQEHRSKHQDHITHSYKASNYCTSVFYDLRVVQFTTDRESNYLKISSGLISKSKQQLTQKLKSLQS